MNIAEALQAKKPDVADMAVRMIESQFAFLLRQFGETMDGVANSRSYSLWNETVRGLCERIQIGEKKPYGNVTHYALSPERLARYADKYADGVIASWEAKIAEKVGELEGATVANISGCQFRISGTRFGHAVTIEQDMIVNVSSKGRLFNQFPARIYLSGKFISAAKYKALAA